MEQIKHIVFYDGVCSMCSRLVIFVMANSKENNIYFSALQSEFAKDFLSLKGISTLGLNT
ncbi:MAG: DUF393 domain-containing protein, partial [Flavobacteriales bacterium]|nr:DUF393 domain-containing protein [Flavobacteriales bacterium]